MDTYDNAFSDGNPYGHVAQLIARFNPMAGDYLVDVGCGYGRIAESLRDRFGIRYLGMDADLASLESLRERGFDAIHFVAGQQDLERTIADALPAGARICAVTALDFIEHLVDPGQLLAGLARVAAPWNAPLVLSVPNVAHRDLGAKLLLGMFEYTNSGLLDRTHIQFFTQERLSRLVRAHGWHEVHQHDFCLRDSDQHEPRSLPGLSTATPLGQLFSSLREEVDDHAYVNQFIRAYLPGPEVRDSLPVPAVTADSPRRFLSVVIRTTGTRIGTLREGLLCLSAQSDQDFEVVIVGHNLSIAAQIEVERLIEQLHTSFRERVRLVLVNGGGRSVPLNTGFRAARGEYVVAFDDDDLLFAGWVHSFKKLAANARGALLRQCTVAQDWDRVSVRNAGIASRATGAMRSIYPAKFDLLAHIVENRTPLHSIAFPRTLFSHMGFEFDPQHTTAEDWDLIIRTAPLCGVATTQDVGCIYRHWKADTSYTAHAQFEWSSNYLNTLKKLNDQPLLLPRGTANRLRGMYAELQRLRGDVDVDGEAGIESALAGPILDDQERLAALRERYFELVTSKSWKVTAPLRALKRMLARHAWVREPRIWLMSEAELDTHIRQIMSSSSWAWTRILRQLRR